jgi:hypothetical protein
VCCSPKVIGAGPELGPCVLSLLGGIKLDDGIKLVEPSASSTCTELVEPRMLMTQERAGAS